ncbi:DUF3817 domain-containing protein [Actinoplanes sp. NPDC049316]|uniref:DUF3817 domain-containing protein n=1 Tax=Actinoplanes sp. NPDC049316 TaxID=3154727 RepID=UPI00342979B1
MPSRPLRLAALVELASLVVLLVNLATVHVPEVASLAGPVHGCAYLVVVGATLRDSADGRARLLAVVPGAGGLLAIRRITGRSASEVGTPG